MKFKLPKPVNETQRLFAELCEKGGGMKGGPARKRVQELLRDSGKQLNKLAESEVANALADNGDQNPWHVCFAVGLSWGHIADLSEEFIASATRCLGSWNDVDLKIAKSHHYERGPNPIEQSLRGGHVLFSKVVLPKNLPASISGMKSAQDRWLSPILSRDRPAYIGSWNSTAMFMIAMFAQPRLGDKLIAPEIGLPPGGPIHTALNLLYQTGVLSRKPDGNELDEQEFNPGSIFTNTGLMAELNNGLDDWDLLDVHSGLYMLGTRLANSDTWFATGSFT